MRSPGRSDIPTGSWSLNISCGSVDIWWTFTLSMSWWTTVSWQTTSDEIPPCHTGRQLLDGGIVALSSLGFTRKKRNYSSSLFPQLLGYTMCTPPGLALSCWLHWWLCFLGSTSYCWIAIVCRLPCLKLKTCGRRLSWHDIQHILKVAFQRRTHCGLSHVFAQIHGWCTHSIVYAALEWGKGPLWWQNHTPNSMRGLPWFFDPLTHRSLTGMPGHSASRVP